MDEKKRLYKERISKKKSFKNRKIKKETPTSVLL